MFNIDSYNNCYDQYKNKFGLEKAKEIPCDSDYIFEPRILHHFSPEWCKLVGFPVEIIAGNEGFYVLFLKDLRETALYYFDKSFQYKKKIPVPNSLWEMAWDAQSNHLIYIVNDLVHVNFDRWSAVDTSKSRIVEADASGNYVRDLIKPGLDMIPVRLGIGRDGPVVFDVNKCRIIWLSSEGKNYDEMRLPEVASRNMCVSSCGDIFIVATKKSKRPGLFCRERILLIKDKQLNVFYDHLPGSPVEMLYDVAVRGNDIYISSINYITKYKIDGTSLYRVKFPNIVPEKQHSFYSMCNAYNKIFGIVLNSQCTSGWVFETNVG